MIKKTILENKKLFHLTKFVSNKWIVMTTINPPSSIISFLTKKKLDWKIVVVGDKKTNDDNWSQFEYSNELIYLSLEEQKNLTYKTLKYLSTNSYSRKTIGYLYAIQHGAKEILEIDDDILTNFNNKKWKFNETGYDRVTICTNNNSQMINPYSYFGLKDIWPRGFKLNDLDKYDNHIFFNLASTQVNLKPLVFQGLINGNPDIDSIFLLTRIQNNHSFEVTFSENYPLLYLPGNYVPINSKNTKYLYDIFPVLPLPTTINKKLSDIIRGFIIQNYAWKINGVITYISSDSYREVINNFKYSSIEEEKYLYFYLDKILNILNKEDNLNFNNPIDYILNLIEKFVSNNILGENDLYLYKAFLEDLSNFGFVFPSYLQKHIPEKSYFFSHSKLYTNYIFQQNILLENNKNENIRILKHKYSNKTYNDILLAINYNYEFLVKLNDYLYELYHKNFPNIAFITPGNSSSDNMISCPESNDGHTAYMCFRKVYEKYPNFKGYLILDDDNFM